MKYVLIGNSTAAIGAVEGIRKCDKDGEIIIISNEPYHTYSRPLISYLLLGKVTMEGMKYRPDSFYEDNKCTLLLSKTAEKIDPSEKTVHLDDGSKIPYDKLLIATGSSPFVPPAEGLDTVEKKFTFMSLDNAKALEEAITEDSRVLIIGAGLIGLKCAEGISKRVKDIKVVDLAPTVLSSILDPEGALMVQSHLENNGIGFYLEQSVKRFDGNTAVLSGGDTVEFDVLVLAVGVRPNVGLIKEPGGSIGRGIVVNDKMETTLPDIYAAGDCTESYDVSGDRRAVLALLPNAYMQGECAGINMAGSEAVWDKAIPMNAISLFGLHIITAGCYKGEVYFESCEKNYKKLFYSDDHLNGFILIGKVDKAGIYTSLIRERTSLESIDFELVCKNPGLMAFSKEDRKTKLGSKR